MPQMSKLPKAVNCRLMNSDPIEKFPSRITATLIDANNTFTYYSVKDFVLLHLQQVIQKNESEEQLYAFYKLRFGFIKDVNVYCI